MKLRFLVATAIATSLVLAAPALAAEAPAPAPVLQPAALDLDALLAKAMTDRSVPAMAVMTVRGGKVDRQAVAGVRAAGSPDRAKAGDVWHIGSNTKAMTATLIARLVEKGVLSWDAPLERMLPGVEMRPEYRNVTLVDLLAHHAGLPENPDLDRVLAFYEDKRPLPAQRQAYAALALGEAPASAPGTTAAYSNSGYVIAAAIAERATGQSWETLIRREVFAPLGMKSAGVGSTKPGQPLGHEGGKPLTGPRATNPLVLAPAGEVYLSLQDWSKFLVDQMNGEAGRGRLLKAESYRFLHTPVSGSRFALGWGVRALPDGGPVMLTHNGSNGYWFAAVAMVPETGRAVMVTANAAEDAGGDKAVTEVIRALIPGLTAK